jgi:hypothetical protein
MTRRVNRLGVAPRVAIEVSENRIDNAAKSDSGHCMIADSIKEQVPGATYVSVDLATVRWSDPKKGERYVYLTPVVAQQALVNWDFGVRIEPFKFTLRNAQVTYMWQGSGVRHRATREEKLAVLEAKLARGDTLTKTENRSLKQLRRPLPPPRRSSPGRKTVDVDNRGVIQVKGGHTPPRAVLSHLPGKRRVFGLRLLRPPVVDDGKKK